MKITVNVEQFKKVGNFGVRIGKTVLVEGCKAVALNTAKTVVQAGYEGGLSGVKTLNWNDLLSDKEARTYKKLKNKDKVNSLKAENAMLKSKLAEKELDEKLSDIQAEVTQ